MGRARGRDGAPLPSIVARAATGPYGEADGLIKAKRHGCGNVSDYWYWLRAKHLLGDTRWNVNVVELEREQMR